MLDESSKSADALSGLLTFASEPRATSANALSIFDIFDNYMVDENSKSMNSLSGVLILLTGRKYEPEAKIRNALTISMVLWLLRARNQQIP